MWDLIAVAGLLWLASSLALAWLFRKRLLLLWREPILAQPVVILESDDWGPAPADQQAALATLHTLLLKHRDSQGNPAHMTLGVLLATPNTDTTPQAPRYQQFADLGADDIRHEMERGQQAKIFSLQLHGWTHYDLDVLYKASAATTQRNQWLRQAARGDHEQLPSPLQSRWIDASSLPSQALSTDKIQVMAKQEVDAFGRLFGSSPTVWVPPTFVWTTVVEQAMKTLGLKYIITPGTRLIGRDQQGKPMSDGSRIYNGQLLSSGLIALVRNTYFEPALGHSAGSVLESMRQHVRQGRPTLVETHRFNYLGQHSTAAFAELDRLLSQICRYYPDVRFISSQALASGQSAPELRPLGQRLAVFIERLAAEPRLGRLAKILGWLLIAKMLPNRPTHLRA